MGNYTEECVQAQRDFCAENGLPCFIYYSGRCPACGRNLFDLWADHAYKLEDAQSKLITRCPYCSRTFCD